MSGLFDNTPQKILDSESFTRWLIGASSVRVQESLNSTIAVKFLVSLPPVLEYSTTLHSTIAGSRLVSHLKNVSAQKYGCPLKTPSRVG